MSSDRPDGRPVDEAVRAVGKPVRRSGSRRVVMVSEVDAKRIESGEFGSAEEVLHASDRKLVPVGHAETRPTGTSSSQASVPASSAAATARIEPGSKKQAMSARDREILNEVPPHFGNL